MKYTEEQLQKLQDNINFAIKQFTAGNAIMHIPAEETDTDLVLSECWALVEQIKEGEPILKNCTRKVNFNKPDLDRAGICGLDVDYDTFYLQRLSPKAEEMGNDRFTVGEVEWALKEIEYKYFGEYKLSDKQKIAVDILVWASKEWITMGLTDKEKVLIDSIVNIWNLYLKLPSEHEMEKDEFCRLVHQMQNMIASRPTYRKLRG